MSQVPKAAAAVAVSATAVLVLGGCSAFDDSPDDVVYCVDADNKVIDDSKCDDSSSSGGIGSNPAFWYLIGRYQGGLSQGTVLDPSVSKYRVPFNDPVARSNAGLSQTGKVSQIGKSVSGKSAGLGSSNGGSGSKSGGFGSTGSSGG